MSLRIDSVYQQRIQAGYDFVSRNKVVEDANTKSIGGNAAIKLFKELQLDKGKKGHIHDFGKGNGTDFKVSVIEEEISRIEDLLNDDENQLSIEEKADYKNLEKVLNGILDANSNDDGKVTLKEFKEYLKENDNKFVFEKEPEAASKPQPAPEPINDFPQFPPNVNITIIINNGVVEIKNNDETKPSDTTSESQPAPESKNEVCPNIDYTSLISYSKPFIPITSIGDGSIIPEIMVNKPLTQAEPYSFEKQEKAYYQGKCNEMENNLKQPYITEDQKAIYTQMLDRYQVELNRYINY